MTTAHWEPTDHTGPSYAPAPDVSSAMCAGAGRAHVTEVVRWALRCCVRHLFAVERIRECQVLAVRFDVPEKFDVEKYLAGAWGIIRGDIVTVKVLFARSLARYIRDRLWHPTQKFHDLDDGRLEMTLRVADTLEVRRWILGFGPEAETLEPATLRDALRREAEALATKLAPQRRLPMRVPLPMSEQTRPHFRRPGAKRS